MKFHVMTLFPEMIENAKKQGADMAVLPEMFNCPYENDKFIEYGESFTNSETLNAISKTAKKLEIHVLAGSIPEREIKEEEDKIYLLMNSKMPGVLCECGFLSNPEEEKNLSNDEYQSKVAFTIYSGLMEFLSI